MAEEKEYVSAVNGVIAICKDAEEGFRGAANAVNNPALKRTLEQYSAQRAAFAAELQEAVRATGSEPSNPAGVAGKVHRGWIALKGVLTGHSEHQILEETERGEDLSLKNYRDALAKTLPAQLRSIVERQYQDVQEAHNNIKALRDSTGHGSSSAAKS